MRAIRLVVVLLVILLAGLAVVAARSGVALETDRRSYRPGDPVILRLSNRTVRAIGYNLCGPSLERRSAPGWRTERSGSGDEVVCTAELRIMPPGGTARGGLSLSGDLPPGSYRVRHKVEIGGEWREVVTPAFRVSR